MSGTEVVLETATFVDAVRKACRVAPTRGSAFDKAAGVVIEVHPDSAYPVIIRSTNLDVYYMQWINSVSITGPRTVWRVNSSILDSVANALPMRGGNQVTLSTDGNTRLLHLKQDRIKSKLNLMIPESFPTWSAFDPTDIPEVQNFLWSLQRVEWAAGSTETLAGIRVDGKTLVATDRYKIAVVPFEVDIEEEFIIPAKALTGVLPNSPVKLKFEKNMICILPDDQTQIKVLALAGEYIKIDQALRRKKPVTVPVKKTALLELCQRAMSVRGSDRDPALQLFIGRGEIAAMVENDAAGLFGDVIDVEGATHKRIKIKFTPDQLIAAVENAPGETISLCYDPEKPGLPVYIKGFQGYESWITVRREMSNG